jgi:inorganic phosphate transporter, PiT family
MPVELILQVGSSAGFAMVFALLIAAILWNLGTWYFGLPASSSHTLIGSIIGVGVANALMRGRDGTSGVDWSKATRCCCRPWSASSAPRCCCCCSR